MDCEDEKDAILYFGFNIAVIILALVNRKLVNSKEWFGVARYGSLLGWLDYEDERNEKFSSDFSIVVVIVDLGNRQLIRNWDQFRIAYHDSLSSMNFEDEKIINANVVDSID